MASNRYEITNGPSKFDLMMSLFSGATGGDQSRLVRFDLTTEDGERMSRASIIDGVRRESGSGESWNIEGYLMQVPQLQYKALYATTSRKGFLLVESKPALGGG